MSAMNVRMVLTGLALGALVSGSAWGAEVPKEAKPAAKASANEVAVLETSKGRMVVEFWDKEAPQTVANFKKLARQGFYDGTGFHRIIKGFMIQGGDPKSKNPNAPDLGTGGPGYTINDEFNAHKHVKGVLSMANTGTPNSAGSQFFVMHGTASSLDGHYTAFGHLISGMDVLEKIANSPTVANPSMPGETSKPSDWTVLKSVKIVPRASALAGSPAKKAEASKPAAAKHTETKAGMGAGAGVDIKAAESKPAESTAPPSESTTPAPTGTDQTTTPETQGK